MKSDTPVLREDLAGKHRFCTADLKTSCRGLSPCHLRLQNKANLQGSRVFLVLKGSQQAGSQQSRLRPSLLKSVSMLQVGACQDSS